MALRAVSASPTLGRMAEASGAPRLPTRCPVCKGAGIERMPNPTQSAYVWFHCPWCNHTWKFLLEDPRPA